MSDPRPIFIVVGILLATLGAAMFVPALIDLAYDNDDWQVFTASGLITMLVGLGLFMAARGTVNQLNLRQAFIMTVVTWLALATFGALPFIWAGVVPSFVDAFFESMSGLTTTGATVIVGLDSAPPGILFWRAILQWLGGLGIIVMAVAVLPMLQIGGMQLFKAEAFDTAEKILPRATQISGWLTGVFVLITLACALAYAIAGMSIADAFIHAMTTVATGGFSSRDDSIGFFNSPAIDTICIVFMVLGSLPFLLYVKAMQGRPAALLRDSQVRTFLLAAATFILLTWIYEHWMGVHQGLSGLRFAAFNVVSVMTGTGYSTDNYNAWGPFSVTLFFFVMFIGGCAGSTSCGIKIFRFQVLAQNIRQHIGQIIYPNAIIVRRFNGVPLTDKVSMAVLTFIFLYFVSFAVLSILLSLTGLDPITALSGAATAISNVGPGLGEIIGPAGNFKSLNETAKWLLAAGMLLGRLELVTVLVLFVPRFWRT